MTRNQQPKCELLLKLPAIIISNSEVDPKVFIKNVYNTEVTLVLPGDGSECQWRTPFVGWSVLPANSNGLRPKIISPPAYERCGNINPLQSNEVFTLKPGNKKSIHEWIDPLTFSSPGNYRVVFQYTNAPKLKWYGEVLGEHDVETMRRLRCSTPISLISNEVIVQVI
jgi:hypothetical protein